MSLNSPFATQIGRGGYSAIVFKDGDLCVTENSVGVVIKENPDDATVIQAAIDALPAKGGLIAFSEGEFDISSTINVNKHGAHLLGASAGFAYSSGGTRFYSSSNIDIMKVYNSAGRIRHPILENFTIEGSGATNGHAGIYLSDGTDLMEIKGVDIEKCQIGFKLHGGNHVADAAKIFNCGGQQCGKGLELDKGAHLKIISGEYSDNLEASLELESCGISIRNSYDVRVIGISAVRNHTAGVLIGTGNMDIFVGGGSDIGNTTKEGITLWDENTTASKNIIINSVFIHHCALGGLTIKNTENVNIINSIIFDDNTHPDISGAPVQIYGIHVKSGASHVLIRDNIVYGNITAAIYDETNMASYFISHFNLFMDIIAASADYVHAAITGTGAEQEITTAITNPDVPRNISITNSANSTGDVVITGIDAKGNSITDTITIVTGGIAYGVVAFTSVSKITIPSTVANPDTISVGISDKLGLSNIIYVSGDVYKVKVNNADDPTIGTVNTTHDTVDCATINAADDITIWYKSNWNILS